MTNKIDEQDALMSRVDATGFLDVCILLIKYTIQAIVELTPLADQQGKPSPLFGQQVDWDKLN